MGQKIILGLFCFLFLFSFVSAVPPITTEFIGNKGLNIQANIYDYYEINTESEVHIYVFNLSNGAILNNETVTCEVELTNSVGTVLLEGTPAGHDDHFLMMRNASVVTEPGIYSVSIVCSTDEIAGIKTHFFQATITGNDLTTAQGIIYLISFSFLIFIFGLLIWTLEQIPRDIKDDGGFIVNVSKLEHLRPIVKGLAWIVLTGIVFIIANITIAYLSTGLMGSFLFLTFQIMMLSNFVIIPLMIIRMIQRITLSKEMSGMIERGVKFS